jgi:Cof subfamily protein (haloacid dehalogenase superfamily)
VSRALAAIALDIDGTLITSDKVISPFTRSEIHRVAREYGVHVFLVTARSPQSTAIIERQLGLAASYASFGGAMVLAREGDRFEALLERPMDPDLVRDVLRRAQGSGAHIGVYRRDTWTVSAIDYWGLREARNTGLWPVVGDVGPDADAEGVFKIMFRQDPVVLDPLGQRLAGIERSAFVHRVKRGIEIISSDAVKLPALRMLAQHHGVGLDQVIAFGDTEADAAMLDAAGVGVLMAGNDVAVGEHVERTLSHDEDGIAMMLRKHFPTDAPFEPLGPTVVE